MASNELVPLDDALALNGDRRAALERLVETAEAVATPEEAREVMIKGRTLAELLEQAKAPQEEAWMAGKASVLAARRLGFLLSELPAREYGGPGCGKRGPVRAPRREMSDALGLHYALARSLVVIASPEVDPAFQQYIQSRDRIPTATGAAIFCGAQPLRSGKKGWKAYRQKRAGVKVPKNPSLDEAYSLIVRALGHLDGLNGVGSGSAPVKAVRVAIPALYAAEDALRPYRGGYVK